MSEIENIHDAEEDNYRIALKILGDTSSLHEELVELYQVLRGISVKSKIAARDEIVTGLHLLVACQYQLTIGCLAALRCHLTDSFRSSRMAIELAAFAARIKRHPHLALVWLNAGDNDQAYEDYRKKFSGGKLFPDDDELLKQLGDRYAFSSKLGHPSVYSMASHTKITKTDSGLSIQFDYFQVKKNDPTEPTQTFLWTIQTHFMILRVFEDVLADALAYDRAVWELRRNQFEAKFLLHLAKWKKVLGK